MKSIPFLPAVMILLSACNNIAGKTQPDGLAADSQVRDIYAGKVVDTAVHLIHKESVEDDPEENLDTVLHRTIAEYKQPYVVDTAFITGGNNFRLHLKHYCLMDSAIRVPKLYLNIYGLDSFVAHNFATDIRLDRNGKTILQRSVYKKDFEEFLEPLLRKNAALHAPYLTIVRDTIRLGYSISIPLTDVGVGVTMTIDDYGAARFK